MFIERSNRPQGRLDLFLLVHIIYAELQESNMLRFYCRYIALFI